MTAQSLQFLLARAVRIGGGDLCAAEHDWQSIGGRACPHDEVRCSQAVFQCQRCGEYDYGEKGGPGYACCGDSCQFGHSGSFPVQLEDA